LSILEANLHERIRVLGVRSYVINDHRGLYAKLFWCKALLETINLGFTPSNILGLGHSDFFASVFNYRDGPRGRHNALNNENGFLQRKSGEACG
jgi:hypothetical protein